MSKLSSNIKISGIPSWVKANKNLRPSSPTIRSFVFNLAAWGHRLILWYFCTYCPPTLVKGGYGNGFVRLSVRRHNLVSASPPTVFKGFWWNLLFPCPEDVHILSRLCWTDFVPDLWPLNIFQQCLVFATPLAVFSGLLWNLPVIVPMTWRGSYYTEVRLDAFYQNYGPLSVLAILSTEVFVSETPPTFFKGF